MKSKVLLCLFAILVLCKIALPNSEAFDRLQAKVDSLNDNNKNEESILLLEGIITDKSADPYAKYFAYILKALTYKRLYNYTEAFNNLSHALREGQQSTHAQEAESRVMMEHLFIHFDLRHHHEFNALLEKIGPEQLKHIKGETRVFYESILGHLELQKGNYDAAEKYFDYCILLLERDNPRHLPNIYKVKVELYNKMNKKGLALQAYEKGVFYAEKYNVDIYKIVMLETLLYYYIDNEDYKNAYFTQLKVSEMRLQYNDRSRSGKLVLLEKKIAQEQAENIQNKDHKIKILLLALSIILIIMLILIGLLFRANRQRKIYMERENIAMRNKLKEIIDANEKENVKAKTDLSQYDLSCRQKEIIDLVRNGKSNKEISLSLFISENTVKYHLKNIFETLGIDKRTELK